MFPDGSYCTQIDARIPRDRQEQAAQTILQILTVEGASKRLMERISWIHQKNIGNTDIASWPKDI